MTRKVISTFLRSWSFFYQHITHHQARAVALSYYTLFALVPFIILMLAIARGLFLEKEISLFLLKTFRFEEKVLSLLLTFAFRVLEGTKGIIFVGSALMFYFWSSYALIGRLEKSLNKLLQFKSERSILQRLYIYPLILLFFPLISLAISAFTFSLRTTLTQTILTSSFLNEVYPYLIILLRLLSPILNAFLIALGYFSIPNGKVEWRPALYAGLVVAVLHQFFLWGYFYFQLHMINYDPFLGTFAIFPLFLLWLNLNWLIFLLGGEILASQHRPNNTPDASKEILP